MPAEEAILGALASVADEVTIRDILLTHGHDDHTGSAAALAERTGARVLGPTADALVIEGARPAPPPNLRDWEVPLYQQSLPHVPQAIETFRRLATLDVEIACFGHGAPLVGDAGGRLRQVAAAL